MLFRSQNARRDDPNVNTIPAEAATMAPDGVLKLYAAEQNSRRDLNLIPSEIATRSVDGVIEYY